MKIAVLEINWEHFLETATETQSKETQTNERKHKPW